MISQFYTIEDFPQKDTVCFQLWSAKGFSRGSVFKNPTAVQKTWVQFLGQKDPLEEETAAHAGVLPWRILWIVKPGRLQSTGLQSVRHDWSDWANTAVTRSTNILNVYVHESVFQTELKNKYACRLLDSSHPGWCVMVPHCGFDLPLILPSIFNSISVFSRVSSSHQMAKALEFQLQHQSFQWIPRTDLL